MGKIRCGIYRSYYEYVGLRELFRTDRPGVELPRGCGRTAGVRGRRRADGGAEGSSRTGNRGNSGEPENRSAGRPGFHIHCERECTGYPGIQRRRWYADGIFPDAGEPLCHRRRREAADSLCGQLDRIYCAAEQSGDDDPDVVSQL